MLLPQEIIRIKRDGLVLNNENIQCFVDGLVDGSFTDSQVGAMAMAIFNNGMSTAETVALTQAMMNSGQLMSWPEIHSFNGPIIDKHSTGGVGDKVSFMLGAIVAACGGYVPMVSGRGLGHTGGTADKLESIKGFNVQPSIKQFKQVVKQCGLAIISQTENLAPADKRLYGIRDVSATVESIPLITASILSKKLAEGLDVLVMDVKVGNGAMMQEMTQAQALAQSIVDVANGAGVKTQAIITDMNQVLGNSAGNALEMIETLEYLSGTYRDNRLHEVVVSLSSAMLTNSGLAKNDQEALTLISQALDSGKAAEIFAIMIASLDGPSNLFEQPWHAMKQANVTLDIISTQSGYLEAMDTRAIGLAVVELGGGRTAPSDSVDHSVGFDQILALGTKISKGDIIARVHAKNLTSAKQASKQYLNAVVIKEGAEQKEKRLAPVIYQTVG